MRRESGESLRLSITAEDGNAKCTNTRPREQWANQVEGNDIESRLVIISPETVGLRLWLGIKL